MSAISASQCECLQDADRTGGLTRYRMGWAATVRGRVHRPQTVQALARLGYLDIEIFGTRHAHAYLTREGRRALVARAEEQARFWANVRDARLGEREDAA